MPLQVFRRFIILITFTNLMNYLFTNLMKHTLSPWYATVTNLVTVINLVINIVFAVFWVIWGVFFGKSNKNNGYS